MWKSYFFNIQKKYSMRLSKNNPLIIRLDGKHVTKNKNIDLLDTKTNVGFGYALEQSAKYFTEKYNCLAIFGSDEISFICEMPKDIVKDLDSDENYHSNEVISMFTQYFFDYFNEFDKHKKVYWHGKCFSIAPEKINSYIIHRSKVIENVLVTYFLMKNKVYNGNEKLEDRISRCKELANYDEFENIQKGILYYSGKRINLNEYITNGKIEEINKINIDEMFSDL